MVGRAISTAVKFTAILAEAAGPAGGCDFAKRSQNYWLKAAGLNRLCPLPANTKPRRSGHGLTSLDPDAHPNSVRERGDRYRHFRRTQAFELHDDCVKSLSGLEGIE